MAYLGPELNILGGPRYIGGIASYFATADFRLAYGELANEEQMISGNASGLGDLMKLYRLSKR